MKRRVIVRQRALLREQEFNVFQRLLASTLSACIFASTLIVQHAQAQMVVSDQSAGSEAIPQGKTKTKKFINYPGLGAGAGLTAGVSLGAGPGTGSVLSGTPSARSSNAPLSLPTANPTSSVVNSEKRPSSVSKANSSLQDHLGVVDASAGATAGLTLGESAGASAGPALVWGPGPGPGVRTVMIMPARSTPAEDGPLKTVQDTAPVKSVTLNEQSPKTDSQETVVLVQSKQANAKANAASTGGRKS